MSSSEQTGAGVEESFKSTAYARLVETGERERLVQELRVKLAACGWEEELRKYCRKVVQDRGVDSITMDDLLHQVTPVARKNVPSEVRDEAVQRIRQFLTKELA